MSFSFVFEPNRYRADDAFFWPDVEIRGRVVTVGTNRFWFWKKTTAKRFHRILHAIFEYIRHNHASMVATYTRYCLSRDALPFLREYHGDGDTVFTAHDETLRKLRQYERDVECIADEFRFDLRSASDGARVY